MIEIDDLDNIKSWKQLKGAVLEARNITYRFRRKYNLWNQPDFQVSVSFNEKIGWINLDAVNLTNGKTLLYSANDDMTLNYQTIYLKKFFDEKEAQKDRNASEASK